MNSKSFDFDRIVQLADKIATFTGSEGPKVAQFLRGASKLLGASAVVPGPGKLVGAFAAGGIVGAAAALALAPGSGSETRRRVGEALRAAAQDNPLAKRVVEALVGDAPKDEPAAATAPTAAHEAEAELEAPATAEKSGARSKANGSSHEHGRKRAGHASAG